ncbi:MAG: polysaccharide deacetylase family protein [Blastocatellia bacterium]|nr:polysaccharide deacetylase family protein [Blastocatellia bacterium]
MTRLQAENRAIDLFFRDDDADEDEASLWELADLFLRHRLPLNLEVIPGRMEASTVINLLMRVRRSPELLELNQHGWRHINHETTGRKCEFGPSRSPEAQRADIAAGKARMDEAFGSRWHPVFTPPWNRCTDETLRILDQLGFEVFSRDCGKESVSGYRFREISTSLDLYRWKNGVEMRPAEEIVRELILQFDGPAPIGLLLHHKVMDMTAFAFLDWLLREITMFPNIRVHTFRSLMAAKRMTTARI